MAWEAALAGAAAGFATMVVVHPLDVVRTRFQVNDGRNYNFTAYRNTINAVLAISRSEGSKGLYAGFFPAVLGSTVSWGLYFFFYSRAKQRYSENGSRDLNATHHLVSAAEAGILVCLCTNPIWLVKTRLQLQLPLHERQHYSGLHDAVRTIVREEGLAALYKGLIPGLLLVSHGAIQFTAYEKFRQAIISYKRKKDHSATFDVGNLNSVDYAVLGASSKLTAIVMTYPFQVIRARLQQRPALNGIPKYLSSWHVIKETIRFEGVRGLYKGITPNILKNVPAASITFIVYESVLKLFKSRRKERLP